MYLSLQKDSKLNNYELFCYAIFQSLGCWCHQPINFLEIFLDSWLFSPVVTEGLVLGCGTDKSFGYSENTSGLQLSLLTYLLCSVICTFQSPCQKHGAWSLQLLEASPLKHVFHPLLKYFSASSFLDILITSESSFLQMFYVFKQSIKCKAILILFPLFFQHSLLYQWMMEIFHRSNEKGLERQAKVIFPFFFFFSNCSYQFQKHIIDLDP